MQVLRKPSTIDQWIQVGAQVWRRVPVRKVTCDASQTRSNLGRLHASCAFPTKLDPKMEEALCELNSFSMLVEERIDSNDESI